MEKGGSLGFSAFLLVTIYGVIIMKIGKVVLPGSIELGLETHGHVVACLLLACINPLL